MLSQAAWGMRRTFHFRFSFNIHLSLSHNICQWTMSNIHKSILSTTTTTTITAMPQSSRTYCPPSSNKRKTIDKCCSGYRIYDEEKKGREHTSEVEWIGNTQNWPRKGSKRKIHINVKRGCHQHKHEVHLWRFNICMQYIGGDGREKQLNYTVFLS